MRRKVCVVVTARPSYSRIKSALQAILDHPDLELQLVAAGSTLLHRYGSAVESMRDDGFTVDAQVHMVVEGENPIAAATSTGLGLVQLASTFSNLQPDVVVSVADRYETLATVTAAAYMNIPVAHVQGGEVTGSIDEKVRHAVTKLSDLHFVSNQGAAERVIRMGEEPGTVFVTGCPSIDLAAAVLENRASSFDPLETYGGVGASFDTADGYLVVMQHPVTTEHEMAMHQVTATLAAVRQTAMPTFWFWPNQDAGSDGTSKGIRVFREAGHAENIHFFRNMGPEDFLRLLLGSRCLIGNSSVGVRECAFLGVPAVNIGTRQAGRQRGRNLLDVDYEGAQIADAIEYHLTNGRLPSDPIYGDGHAGERIAGLLAEEPLRTEKRLTY